MTLEDLENAVLLQLQEANVNFGSQAVFASGANYSQATLDWAINRAYGKLLDDLGDISIVTQTLNFPSVQGQYSYAVPVGARQTGTLTTNLVSGGNPNGIVLTASIGFSLGNLTNITYTCKSTDSALSAVSQLSANINASTLVTSATPSLNPMQQNLNAQSQFTYQNYGTGNIPVLEFFVSSTNSAIMSITATATVAGTTQSPNIRTIRSVSYQPLGLTYNLYRAPGVRLISWKEYQELLVDGYMQYFSAGQFPDYLALNTTRTKLHMYPTPYESGDTVTVDYCPQLTNSANVSAANWGYLVNSTDAPPSMLPEDVQDCIWMYACFLLWPKSRELGTAQLYLKMYEDKMRQTKENYMLSTQGDAFGIRDKAELVGAGYGFSNWFSR